MYLQCGRTFTIFSTNVKKNYVHVCFSRCLRNHVFPICQACFNSLAGFCMFDPFFVTIGSFGNALFICSCINLFG